mgnify:CR=1 FL=1
MIKVVHKNSKNENTDLLYWLSRSPEERLNCVQNLRQQYIGHTERLQRSLRSFQRTKS